MAKNQPLVEHEDVVRPEWIDANGHMNLAYYVVAFDAATDKMYDLLGIGTEYRETTGNSCFTVETHMLYERELLLGEQLRVHSYLLGADAKRLHYFHEMFHVRSGERAAAHELLALHIDMRARCVAPFPADRAALLADAVRKWAPTQPMKGVGRRIALPGWQAAGSA